MASVTCRCGTQIPVGEDSRGTPPRCPDCGREIPAAQAEQPAGGGRGLWAVMGRAKTSSAPQDQPATSQSSETPEADIREPHSRQPETRAEADPQETDEAQAEHSKPAESPDQVARPRGLWQLMQGSASGSPQAAGQPAEQQAPGQKHSADPQSARDTTAKNEAYKEVSPRKPRPAAPPLPDGLEEPVELDDLQDERTPAAAPAGQSSGTSPTAATPPLLSGPRRAGIPAVPEEATAAKAPPKSWLQRRGLLSLLLGLVALPLSALSALPEVWAKLPATAAGFAALALGLIAWNSGSRREPRVAERSLAAGGIGLGLLAMFLGPLVIADLGRRMRTDAGTQKTFDHLSQVGDGLVRFHDHRNSFPPGGVIARDAKGRDLPMHSWMTLLLPWIGEEELANSINQDLPWSHRENVEAMSRVVSAFVAGDQPATPVGSGFGPAHFAGVGGEGLDDRRGLVQLGIFGRNSRVTREDVIDGLSTTLVAGEISTLIPPWGEPTNWRSIGRGLNSERAGFGNAAGTGALMLRADGSVRFYSSRTSPEVLRRLSTRNGGEHIAREHR